MGTLTLTTLWGLHQLSYCRLVLGSVRCIMCIPMIRNHGVIGDRPWYFLVIIDSSISKYHQSSFVKHQLTLTTLYHLTNHFTNLSNRINNSYKNTTSTGDCARNAVAESQERSPGLQDGKYPFRFIVRGCCERWLKDDDCDH